MKHLSVLSYGVGNLRSVVRALTHVGASVTCISHPEEVEKAERLVVPGVGAFRHCADALRRQNLWQPIADYLADDRPFLGICVGMQLMLEASEEFGVHSGFAAIEGRVARLPKETNQKIPMVGWKAVKSLDENILFDPSTNDSFYFVHSYAAKGVEAKHTLATYNYGGSQIVAAVGRQSKFGTQFHPEKSGEAGLSLLKRFTQL